MHFLLSPNFIDSYTFMDKNYDCVLWEIHSSHDLKETRNFVLYWVRWVVVVSNFIHKLEQLFKGLRTPGVILNFIS